MTDKFVRLENYSGAFKRKNHWRKIFGYGDDGRREALEFHKKLCAILEEETANLYITEVGKWNEWISVLEFDDDYIEPLIILEFMREEENGN